jgi:predicted nucleic acid-binding protein
LLDTIIDVAVPVEVHYQWRPQLTDAGDEMVLEAAVNGQADAIVTFNRRDYKNVSSRFGIEVLSPIETLRRVRK